MGTFIPSQSDASNTKRDLIRDQEIKERLRAEQNLVLGVVAGAIAALFGAFLWASITVVAGLQSRLMAIGIGAFIGYVVKKSGKGRSPVFGILGAIYSLISCVLGNILAILYLVSLKENFPMSQTILNVIYRPGLIIEIIMNTTTFFDILMYATASLLGYFISLRTLTRQELEYIYRERDEL